MDPDSPPKIVKKQKSRKPSIYVVTNATYRYLNRYRIGHTMASLRSLRAQKDRELGKAILIAFFPGSLELINRLYKVLAKSMLPGGDIVMPLGNLLATTATEIQNLHPELGIFEALSLAPDDNRNIVTEDELKQHLVVFLRLYKRQKEGIPLYRDDTYIAFEHYLQSLMLFSTFVDYCNAMQEMGYAFRERTNGAIIVNVKEIETRYLRQMILPISSPTGSLTDVLSSRVQETDKARVE